LPAALRNQSARSASSDANLHEILVSRFLKRYGSVRRAALLDKLNRLALQISNGNHGALTFRWAELRPEQLPWADSSEPGIGLRELHALKNALHSMLREGVANGAFDQHMYRSIVKRAGVVRKPGSREVAKRAKTDRETIAVQIRSEQSFLDRIFH